MELKTPRLIQVTWRDCETHDGWIDVPSLISQMNNKRIIKTVGFLIHVHKDSLLLASSWETEFGKVGSAWIIPKSQIQETRDLTTGKRTYFR